MSFGRLIMGTFLCLGLLAAWLAPAWSIDYLDPKETPAKVSNSQIDPVREQPELSQPMPQRYQTFRSKKHREDGASSSERRSGQIPSVVLPTDCLPGFLLAELAGRAACVRCLPGSRMIRVMNTLVCAACPRGFQGRPFRGRWACVKCPPNAKLVLKEGRFTCLSCPEGYIFGENYKGTACVRY